MCADVSMPSSKVLFFLLISFIFGIAIASFWQVPMFIMWEFFVLAGFYFFLFLLLSLRESPRGTIPRNLRGTIPRKLLTGIVFGLCLVFLGLGIFRGSKVFSRASLGEFLQGQPSANSYFNCVKNKFREVINSNLPQPQSAILSGILLGDKLSISKEWKDRLAKTGTSHIVAVSGMNIVMLSSILVAFGIMLGLYRQQALWFSLILIWLFIALIGFQASAVRAGIMGSILIFCQILGRQGASFRALVLAVAVMLAINPELLRYSLSFGLSVLATLGLIQLSPVIGNKLNKIKLLDKAKLSEIISAALSAQIFTLPLLIYSFGYVSLVGLFANILIVPLLPTIMVLGIIFLAFGLLNSGLAIILAWPVGILLSLIVWLIDVFSKVPFGVLRI